MIKKHGGEFVIERNRLFMGVGIFVMFLAVLFAGVIASLPYNSSDVFYLIIAFAFLSIVLSLGIYCFVANGKKVIINSDGITCNSIFRKKYIKWCELKDYGLSFCREMRFEGSVYYLYFATEEQDVKTKHKKRLKGDLIKIFVSDKTYDAVINTVIPFCNEKTPVKPFIASKFLI